MSEQPTGFVPATLSEMLTPRDQATFAASNVGSDPLRWLPPTAADRMLALRLRVEDTRALCPPFADRQQAANAKLAAERRLQRLLDHPAQGGFGLPEDNRSVVEARGELKRCADEAKRLDSLYVTREGAWTAASQVLSAVESWLREGRPGNTVLEDYEGPAPKLSKGEDVLSAIENRRRRMRELRADLNRIASSPFPSSYCKQRMRDQISALAERGAVSVSELIEQDSPVQFPTQRLRSMVIGAQEMLAFGETTDSLGLFAWMFKEALISKLDAEISAESDDAAALTHEARQTAEVEVMGDLLATERQEAQLVWLAQAQNLPAEHRANCSPLAILSLQQIVAPIATALPASSPELAWTLAIPGGR